MIKTLLLNNNFQILAFIDERKAIKLLYKNKVEVISIWNGRKIYYSNGFIEYPATLKLKYQINLKPTQLDYSKKLILRRDNYICAYCNMKFSQNKLTIDHIIPKSAGGQNSFTNCITACLECNYKKSNKTLEQAGLLLNFHPFVPKTYLCYLPSNIEWHTDWLFFITP